jgi:hypothetical protein
MLRAERGTVRSNAYLLGVSSPSSLVYDRVSERRRAVALARHLREAEGVSITQIADRLGRSKATIKAYFYDPTGEKARAVKARYVGGVSRLRRLHPAAQRQGRRLPVLQALPPGRDPAEVDAGAGARGDARMASTVRAPTVLIRLVAHPRPPARRRATRATDRGNLASPERRHRVVWDLGCGSERRIATPGWRGSLTVTSKTGSDTPLSSATSSERSVVRRAPGRLIADAGRRSRLQPLMA